VLSQNLNNVTAKCKSPTKRGLYVGRWSFGSYKNLLIEGFQRINFHHQPDKLVH